MRKTHKILSLILCVALVMGFFPKPISAEELPQTDLFAHHTEHLACGYSEKALFCNNQCVVCVAETGAISSEQSLDDGELRKQQDAVIDVDVLTEVHQTVSLLAADADYLEELQDSTGYPESPHDYTSNMDVTYTYQVSGAEYLKVTFSSSTMVESNYDFLYIYDAAGNQCGKYTGSTLAGQTIQIPGDTVMIKLTSDGSYQKYGFSITSIYAGFSADFTSVEIATLPNKVAYKIGDEIDLTGLTLTARNSSGEERTLNVSDGIVLISNWTL